MKASLPLLFISLAVFFPTSLFAKFEGKIVEVKDLDDVTIETPDEGKKKIALAGVEWRSFGDMKKKAPGLRTADADSVKSSDAKDNPKKPAVLNVARPAADTAKKDEKEPVAKGKEKSEEEIYKESLEKEKAEIQEEITAIQNGALPPVPDFKERAVAWLKEQILEKSVTAYIETPGDPDHPAYYLFLTEFRTDPNNPTRDSIERRFINQELIEKGLCVAPEKEFAMKKRFADAAKAKPYDPISVMSLFGAAPEIQAVADENLTKEERDKLIEALLAYLRTRSSDEDLPTMIYDGQTYSGTWLYNYYYPRYYPYYPYNHHGYHPITPYPPAPCPLYQRQPRPAYPGYPFSPERSGRGCSPWGGSSLNWSGHSGSFYWNMRVR